MLEELDLLDDDRLEDRLLSDELLRLLKLDFDELDADEALEGVLLLWLDALLADRLLAEDSVDLDELDLLLLWLLADDPLGLLWLDPLDRELAELAVDELEAVEAELAEIEDALEGVLLLWLLAELAVETLVALDSVDPVDWLDAVDGLLAELADDGVRLLVLLADDAVLCELTRLLLLLDGVEVDDMLSLCDVELLLSVLAELVEVTDRLLTLLWLLTDWLLADDPPVVEADWLLAELAVETEDSLLLVSLWDETLLLWLDSDEELTPELGELPVLPPVVELDLLDSDVTDVSLSHSVARMYGVADRIRSGDVLKRIVVGTRSSPPAASVSVISQMMLSSSVTVRYSTSPPSALVVSKSRPPRSGESVRATRQIETVRESSTPVGAGPR